MKKCLALVVVILCVNLACNRREADSPEKRVREFVDLSAHITTKKEKNSLADFCTGEMRRAFEAMSDEKFRLSYLESKIVIRSFEVVQSTKAKDLARIRYRLVLTNREGEQTTEEINEREVELVKERGGIFSRAVWRIRSVMLDGSDQIAFTRGMVL